jgi:ABC-type branched-subunit amino acid transport system ATPase component
MATIFECENATKNYGGLAAVKDLTFSIEEGETYAIAGPNGAGKTTLFDTITGVSSLSSASIPTRSAGWASRAPSKPRQASTPKRC